jgi:hypothetical protein
MDEYEPKLRQLRKKADAVEQGPHQNRIKDVMDLIRDADQDVVLYAAACSSIIDTAKAKAVAPLDTSNKKDALKKFRTVGRNLDKLKSASRAAARKERSRKEVAQTQGWGFVLDHPCFRAFGRQAWSDLQQVAANNTVEEGKHLMKRALFERVRTSNGTIIRVQNLIPSDIKRAKDQVFGKEELPTDNMYCGQTLFVYDDFGIPSLARNCYAVMQS